VNKLIDASDAFKIWSIDPLTISRPVVEDCKNKIGFLCDDPVKLMRNGNYSKIPVLTGWMKGDGGVRALAYFENRQLLNDLNENFTKLFPKLLEVDDENSPTITMKRLEMIKGKYLHGKNHLEDKMMDNLIQLYTDRSFVAPMANTLLQFVKNDKKQPVYLYKFNFHGRKSYSMFYTGNLKDYGTVHCDELIYLLKSPLLFPQEFEIDSREAKFRSKFVKFITHFVING
jgi:juvenile-hormone esterase